MGKEAYGLLAVSFDYCLASVVDKKSARSKGSNGSTL